jgi:hypothetical protein
MQHATCSCYWTICRATPQNESAKDVPLPCRRCGRRARALFGKRAPAGFVAGRSSGTPPAWRAQRLAGAALRGRSASWAWRAGLDQRAGRNVHSRSDSKTYAPTRHRLSFQPDTPAGATARRWSLCRTLPWLVLVVDSTPHPPIQPFVHRAAGARMSAFPPGGAVSTAFRHGLRIATARRVGSFSRRRFRCTTALGSLEATPHGRHMLSRHTASRYASEHADLSVRT